MSDQISFTESVETLTGFDEQDIEKHFGNDFDSLRVTMQLRALVFVHTKRGGTDAKSAYKAAMEISLKDLGDRFADEEPEVNAEDPITDQGKEPASGE